MSSLYSSQQAQALLAATTSVVKSTHTPESRTCRLSRGCCQDWALAQSLSYCSCSVCCLAVSAVFTRSRNTHAPVRRRFQRYASMDTMDTMRYKSRVPSISRRAEQAAWGIDRTSIQSIFTMTTAWGRPEEMSQAMLWANK